MLARLLLLLVLLLAPVPALAQAQGLAGSWALRIDGAVIFRFELARDGQGWTGSWTRPERFASDGMLFGSLEGSETLRPQEGRAIGEWAELTFADQRPGAVPDVFRFHLLGPDRVEMIYAGTGLPPYTLVRVPAGTRLGPWQEGRVYRRDGAPAPPPRQAPAVSEPSSPPAQAPGTERPPPLPPLDRPAALPPVVGR